MPTRPTRSSLLVPALLALAACSGPKEEDSGPRYAPPPDPNAGPPADMVAEAEAWTTAFEEPAVLVADVVEVVGPPGLLQHLATRAESASHERTEKAVPEGFRVTIEQRADAAPFEIVAYLDRWQIAALRRLVVLERPGPVDVQVTARGAATLRRPDEEQARSGSELTFTGRLGE